MSAAGPLKGLRVLDASNVIAGPFATALLADFGADVIKIEHPSGGDPVRKSDFDSDGVSFFWKLLGRNKRSLGLYLGDPEGAEIFLKLVEHADVVFESFRPGTLERWNLGYERLKAVNPRVVLVRVTGYGKTGPYASRATFGTIIEGMSGYAHITGEADGPPMLPPFGLGDHMAGFSAALAAIMGLYERDAGTSRRGQEINVSIFQSMLAFMGVHVLWHDKLGYVFNRQGNRLPHVAPRGVYRAADGKWVSISITTAATAQRFVRLVGRPDLAGEEWLGRGPGRAEHADLLDELLHRWLSTRTSQQAIEESSEQGVPMGAIYDMADLLTDEHVMNANALVTVKDSELGEVRVPNVLFQMSETPGEIRHAGVNLGQDTVPILQTELGLTDDQIESLRSRHVVR